MKDLTTVLREGDPAAGEAMSAAEVNAIRRRVLNALRQPDGLSFDWQRPLAVAAAVALTLGAGIAAGRRMPPADAMSVAGERVPVEGNGRRQLQFATPGGTRIIWVFDPEFDLEETTP